MADATCQASTSARVELATEPVRAVAPRASRRTDDESPRTVVPPDRDRTSWASRYARRVALTDAVILASAVGTASYWRFGGAETSSFGGTLQLSHEAVGVVMVGIWLAALQAMHARDRRIFGGGLEEYRRVVRASVYTFGGVAIASTLFKWDISRGYLALAFPLGLLGLLLGRYAWRKGLVRQRRRGVNTANVLVIGGMESADYITRWFRRHPQSGLRVTGVWVPDRTGRPHEWLKVPDAFVPVMGTSRRLADALSISEAEVVIVTDTEHLGHKGLKQLAWELHDSDVELFVSPNVMDVVGPRVHLSAVANMPFLQLSEPRYEAASRLSKVVFDKVLALFGLLVLSPFLVAAAVAVKVSSPGPVLYRSERIGIGGEPFFMLKFRSMIVGADEQVASLSQANEADGPLFKMADDPRITRVGKFLRRYSIDELPQFVNVLRGEMSVVGPRPPLRREVEQYDGDATKRLLVRQGVTGLWQVSGRSDLDWEETLRLDLDYVENWSLMRDVEIIWRTVRAVLRSDGAY